LESATRRGVSVESCALLGVAAAHTIQIFGNGVFHWEMGIEKLFSKILKLRDQGHLFFAFT